MKVKGNQFLDLLRHSVVSKVILLGFDFVASVLVTRILGPEGRGVLTYAANFAATMTQFGYLGFNNSNPYYAAKEPGSIGILGGNSLFIAFVLFIVSIIISTVFYFNNLLPIGYEMMLLASFVAFFMLLQGLISSILFGVKKVKLINNIEVFSKIINVIIIIALVFFKNKEPEKYFLISLFVAILNSFVFLYYLRGHLNGLKMHISMSNLRNNLGYSFKAFLAAVLSFLVLKSDVFMIGYFKEVEDVGIYSVAMTLINAIYILPTTVGQLTFMKLINMSDAREKVAFVNKVLLFTAVLVFFILLVAYIAIPIFIPYVFGEEFAGAIMPFCILLIGVFAWSIDAVPRKIYTSDGYKSWVVWSWFMAFCINIVLNYLLIPKHGIEGAAVASSIALSSMSLVVLFKYFKDFVFSKGGENVC